MSAITTTKPSFYVPSSLKKEFHNRIKTVEILLEKLTNEEMTLYDASELNNILGMEYLIPFPAVLSGAMPYEVD